MFGVVTVAALLLGWEFHAVRNRRLTLESLRRQSDRYLIVTSRQLLNSHPQTSPPKVNIIRYIMGDEPIAAIHAHPRVSLKECAKLAEIFPEAKVGQTSRVNFDR